MALAWLKLSFPSSLLATPSGQTKTVWQSRENVNILCHVLPSMNFIHPTHIRADLGEETVVPKAGCQARREDAVGQGVHLREAVRGLLLCGVG